ncbi:MAG: hypothetical protein RL133_149 [Pseudomonadota bacterium]
MRSDSDNDLLSYFGQELAALRESAQDFARRHPRVAQALDLSGQESRDPHVERLIESFAFLTGRLQRDLDREFPRVASGVLENVCPSLLSPIPSMSVAQLSVGGASTQNRALIVPKLTQLHVQADSGEPIRFQTTRSITVWPIQLEQVELTEAGDLCLTIQANPGVDMKALEIDELEFYVQGDWRRVGGLIDLVGSQSPIVLAGNHYDNLQAIDGARVSIPGILEIDPSLALPPGGHPAYQLLQEYFAFPQRFNFLRITGLTSALKNSSSITIALRLGPGARRLPAFGREHMQLACVPIINLFRRTSEPITLREDQLEYRLVADRARESSTEIHSILHVTASQPGAAKPDVIPQHAALNEDLDGGICWLSRRDQTLRENLSGTDVFLSFVDGSLSPASALPPIIYADLLCTNRGLAEQLPSGARLQIEGAQSGIQARLCIEPSRQKAPPLAGDSVWRLTQLLTLTHGSLVHGPAPHKRVQSMLSLFAGSARRDGEQIQGLLGLSVTPSTLRRSDQPWQPFCPGLAIRLELDPEAFNSGSMVIFSGVLARFLTLYCSVDRFIQTSVWRGEDQLIQWPPMHGGQALL